MRFQRKINLKFFQDIDLFSRKLELYYNGKPEKTSRIGTLFTLIYISIFFTIFIYKFIKMIEKKMEHFMSHIHMKKLHLLFNYQTKIFMVVLL